MGKPIESKNQCCPGEEAFVSKGKFKMGSKNGDPDERHVREVQITHNLCVDKYELRNKDKAQITLSTAKQFGAVPIACGTSAALSSVGRYNTAQEAWNAHAGKVDYTNVCGWAAQPVGSIEMPQSPPDFDGPDQPLIVNWYQADAICKARGKRLPTEAEWEYIARGESHEQEWPTNDGKKPEISEARYYARNTANVCSYSGHYVVWGGEPICDMAGNGWEWVSDWYQDSYEGLGTVNPTGPLVKTGIKVLRGGGWDNDGVEDLCASYRHYAGPGYSDVNAVVRCVRSEDSKQ